MDSEQLARKFHETYERLAPDHGYETRKASAVSWENVPEKNKSLMIAVCSEILVNLGKTKVETGRAILEVDDVTGQPYWNLCDEGWKDSEDMEVKESIEFSPTAFPPGTRIVIVEPDMDSEISQEFYKEPKAFYPITDEQYAKLIN